MNRLFLIVLFWISLSEGVYAASILPEHLRSEEENRPVSVVQNRYFIKKNRINLGVFAGTFLNEAYTNTNTTGARSSYFFSEWFGIEGQYAVTATSDSEDRKKLKEVRYKSVETDESVYPDPKVNSINEVAEVRGLFVPFYGKLNFADLLVLYTDIYLSIGFAQIQTDQGPAQSATYGIGERVYASQTLSFQVDFTGRVFREDKLSGSYTRNTVSLDLGANYYFL